MIIKLNIAANSNLLRERTGPGHTLCARCGDQLFPDESLNSGGFCALCDSMRSEALHIFANRLSVEIDNHHRPLMTLFSSRYRNLPKPFPA